MTGIVRRFGAAIAAAIAIAVGLYLLEQRLLADGGGRYGYMPVITVALGSLEAIGIGLAQLWGGFGRPTAIKSGVQWASSVTLVLLTIGYSLGLDPLANAITAAAATGTASTIVSTFESRAVAKSLMYGVAATAVGLLMITSVSLGLARSGLTGM